MKLQNLCFPKLTNVRYNKYNGTVSLGLRIYGTSYPVNEAYKLLVHQEGINKRVTETKKLKSHPYKMNEK